MLPRSIRWRIQIWHGALLLAVLIGFGVVAYRLQRANELRHLDDALRRRIESLAASLQRGGPEHEPPGRRPPRPEDDPQKFQPLLEDAALFAPSPPAFYYTVWRRDGLLLGKSDHAPEPLREPEPDGDSIRSRAGFREMAHFTPPGECLLAGISEDAVDSEMRRFAGGLAALGGIVLALGLAGGWLVATRAIAPIDAISGAAARIADGHLDERIPVAEAGSELGQLAAILNHTFTRLDAAFAQQTRFSSDAAHELRTPVAIILAQAQLALSRPRSVEEHLEIITTIQRSGTRMSALIESLLELSVLDSHSVSEPLQRCDIAEITRAQVHQFRILAGERGITMQTSLDPAPCLADPEKIERILINLLTNAVKYIRPGDEILVSTEHKDGAAILRIADTGPGISAEHLPHLFERFYRADSARNRVTGGAGLGLAICKSLVESQRGEIEVSSREAGSIFTVHLPVA